MGPKFTGGVCVERWGRGGGGGNYTLRYNVSALREAVV